MAIMLNDCSHPYIEKGQSEHTIKARIISNNLNLDNIKCSPKALDLLKRLLHPNPQERIKASDALNHPWLVPNRRQFITNDGKRSNIKTLTANSFYQPVQTSKHSRSCVGQMLKLLMMVAMQRRRGSSLMRNSSWKEKLRSLSKTTSVKHDNHQVRSPSKNNSHYNTNHTATSFYPPFVHQPAKEKEAGKGMPVEKIRIDPDLVQFGINNISEQLVNSVDSRDGSTTNNMFFVRKGKSLSDQREVHKNRFRVVSRGVLNQADHKRTLELGKPRKTTDKQISPFRQSSIGPDQAKKPLASREILVLNLEGQHSSDNRRTADRSRKDPPARIRDLSKTLHGAFLDPYTAQARGISQDLSLERRRREIQFVSAFKTPKRELRNNTLIGNLKSNYEQVKSTG